MKNYNKGWAWPLLKYSEKKKKYLKQGAVSMQIAGAIREEDKESRKRRCVCGNIIHGRSGMLNHNSSMVVGRLGSHGGKVGFIPHSIHKN